MSELWKDFLQDETAQDLIENTLLMGFVALGVAGLFINAGNSVKGIWSVSNSTLIQANRSAAS